MLDGSRLPFSMHPNKTIWQLILFCLSLILITGLGLVQHRARASPADSVQLSGVVLDVAGRPVSNSTVFIRGDATLYTVLSNDAGRWSVDTLPVGGYSLYAISLNPEHDIWLSPRRVTVESKTEITLTVATRANIIASHDFETDDRWQNWQRFNGNASLTTESFDGNAAAKLGDTEAELITCSQNQQSGQLWSLKQPLTIPTGQNPGLSFMYQINTSQTQFNYAWFEVVLLIDDQPAYLIPWGELWQHGEWQLRVIDLSAWQGQSAELIFQAVNCSDEQFEITLDRVTVSNFLGTQVPNATPEPNQTATPMPISNSTPTATVTPNPNADYTTSVRQLTPCENEGKHHIFIYVEDKQGNGIPDVQLRVFWPDDGVDVVTGLKGEHLGLVDFPMFKGSYWVEILDGNGQTVGPITPDIAEDQLCEESGNPVGNSLFHYSYEVRFTKN
ncbi:carboxypeptidase-like regulatory domain-containing protein [Anaerolineales bacterium HSG24]|nr:carboxypeptidase-like regulatory domain-containing protein [Anaerolineales bacterium HSG24]